MNKTLWQKIYSLFGFWTYTSIELDNKIYRVVYWRCFPGFYIRKFDLFWWRDRYEEGVRDGIVMSKNW